MRTTIIAWNELITELIFSTSRSGGSGGQHVNKVETKVNIKFHLQNSKVLDAVQKQTIQAVLAKRIDKNGYINMYSQATRSQVKNKERVIKNFIALIKKSLLVQKKRKATKVPKAVKDKIRKDKSRRSELKQMRKKPDY